MNGQVPPRFARLRADGGIDPDFFGPWLNGPAVRAMALQTDGKILLGGSFTASDSLPRNRLARLQANGPLDTDFEADANAEVLAVAVQADGKILVGGQFTEIAGHAVAYLARLNADGSVDMGFVADIVGDAGASKRCLSQGFR